MRMYTLDHSIIQNMPVKHAITDFYSFYFSVYGIGNQKAYAT